MASLEIPLDEIKVGTKIRVAGIKGNYYSPVWDVIAIAADLEAKKSWSVWRCDFDKEQKEAMKRYLNRYKFKGTRFLLFIYFKIAR
jgi:hypothetical protein